MQHNAHNTKYTVGKAKHHITIIQSNDVKNRHYLQKQIRSHYVYNDTVASTVSKLIEKSPTSPFY